MCLLSFNLDTIGLFLRIWLWISVPMAVVILLVATWLNYRRHFHPRVGLNLAIEGWGGEGLPGGAGTFVAGDETESGRPDSRPTAADDLETGRETIYRGILWMKDRYEQYRSQADRRYALLKEELARSERRYLDLVSAMEQGSGIGVPAGTSINPKVGLMTPGEMTAGEGETFGAAIPEMTGEEGEFAGGEMNAEPPNGALMVSEEGSEVLGGALQTERRKVGELEQKLRNERLKVEELVLKLQTNSQLLMTIYQELDKSLQVERSN